MLTPEQAAKAILENIAKLYVKRHEYGAVDEREFGHLDLKFYNRVARELEAQGFRRLGDYENLTLEENERNVLRRTMLRALVSADGTICAALYHPKLRSLWLRALLFILGKRLGRIVDFETEFSNGCFVCTSNAMSAGRIGSPRQIQIEYRPAKTTAAELLATHQARVADYQRSTGAMPVRITDVGSMFEAQHRMQAIKAAHRGEIGGITKEELEALNPGAEETNEAVWQAIRTLQAKTQAAAANNAPPPTPRH